MTEEERQTAIERKRALQDLTESAGWRMLVAIWEEQLRGRTDRIVLTMIGEGEDDSKWTVHKQEFTKGEVAYGRTMMRLPTILIENFKAILESDHDNANDRDNSYSDDDDDREPDSGFDTNAVV